MSNVPRRRRHALVVGFLIGWPLLVFFAGSKLGEPWLLVCVFLSLAAYAVVGFQTGHPAPVLGAIFGAWLGGMLRVFPPGDGLGSPRQHVIGGAIIGVCIGLLVDLVLRRARRSPETTPKIAQDVHGSSLRQHRRGTFRSSFVALLLVAWPIAVYQIGTHYGDMIAWCVVASIVFYLLVGLETGLLATVCGAIVGLFLFTALSTPSVGRVQGFMQAMMFRVIIGAGIGMALGYWLDVERRWARQRPRSG